MTPNIPRCVFIFASCFVLLLASAEIHAQLLRPPPERPDSFRPDQIIVRIEGPSGVVLDRIQKAVGSLSSKRLYREVLWLVQLPAGSDVRLTQRLLKDLDGVVYAHPNMIVEIAGDPDDPQYGDQWGFDDPGDADIDAPEAWDLHTDGSSKIVAVLDTGVQWDHPDLQANMWTNPGEIPGNGLDDDGNGYVDDVYGYDFVNDDGNPYDDHGHGTHCAGTVGAESNNGLGVAGTCWTAKIMALKILNSDGFGSIADSVVALAYAIDNGAEISSNSWGCDCGFDEDMEALYDLVDEAGDSGHLFVAAAGNAAADNDTFLFYPASFDLPEVLSVAANNVLDEPWIGSNWGAVSVDLYAPGQDVLSTWIGGGYNTISGTSMACPHVSGAVALLTSYCESLTLMEAKQMLMETVDVVPAYTGLVQTDGRLNLHSALLAAPPACVSVINPDGGELYFEDTSTIEWGSSDPSGLIDSIDLWLQDASGVDLFEIASGELNDGEFLWDSSAVDDGYYRIRVSAFDSGGVELDQDSSDDVFRIDRSTTVEVLVPNGGEWIYWITEVEWSAVDADSEIATIDIWLLDEFGTDLELLAEGEPNDGTWTWDSTPWPDGDYLLRIEARNASGQLLGSDLSDDDFHVDHSTFAAMDAPNGGPIMGDSVDILWTATDPDTDIDYVELWLQDGKGHDLSLISTREQNDGHYRWDVSSLPRGAYRIGLLVKNRAGQTIAHDNSDRPIVRGQRRLKSDPVR